jgi:hypothetical protein
MRLYHVISLSYPVLPLLILCQSRSVFFPSAEEAVFARFDKVLLLETGRVAYYGEVKSLRGCLKQLGFACPEGRGNAVEKG